MNFPMTKVNKFVFIFIIIQRAGIAHRDIQPENIFITRNGTVKLGHFSQACPIFENVAELHACRTPVGKEEFMSFEKVRMNIHKSTFLRAVN
jgi:serine/threonine protein kinase